MTIEDVMPDRISTYCQRLEKSMLAKYYAGRKEHNDDLATLDVESEIQEELIDILIYRIISDAQRNG